VLHETTASTNNLVNCGYPLTSLSNGVQTAVEYGTTVYKQNTPSGCVNTTPTYNKSTLITDSSGNPVPLVPYPQGRVYNLGNASVHVYAVRGGTLTMCDWIASDCRSASNYTPVVDDIVSLRAVYGLNSTPSMGPTAGDGNTLPSRVDLQTCGVYCASRVLSVTFEITARSTLREKVNQAGNCVTTPNKNKPDLSQTWIYDGTAGANIDISAVSTDWACYRYKLFQTVVPMRNILWRPQ
jgi:type IV pilus assembly protein PilW